MSRTRYTQGTYLEAIDPFRFSTLKSMASGHAFLFLPAEGGDMGID